MKKFVFILLALIFWVDLPAQSSEVERILSGVNQRISSTKQGYFEVIHRTKSLYSSDTSVHSGRVYFFRKHVDRDSICPFVIVLDKGYRRAYDGVHYTGIDPEKKHIFRQPVRYRGGISNFMSGLCILGFVRYVYVPEKQPLPLSEFKNALIDTVTDKNGVQYLTLTNSDSALNIPDKHDNWMAGRWKTTWSFDLTGTNLVNRKNWISIYADSSVQYDEYALSPVVRLPDNHTFDQLLGLDTLITWGYTMADYTANKTLPIVAAGDLVSDFSLVNLSGDTIQAGNIGKGLILLDFWHINSLACLMAIPSTERLHQQFSQQGLTVLGINGTDTDPADLRFFSHNRKITYPILLDTNKLFSKQLNITAYPTKVLIDAATRRVLHVQQGYSVEMETQLMKIIESNLR